MITDRVRPERFEIYLHGAKMMSLNRFAGDVLAPPRSECCVAGCDCQGRNDTGKGRDQPFPRREDAGVVQHLETGLT
jgi:hypothetical protein